MAKDPSADPNQFAEAVAAFRKRVPITREQWERLTTKAREFAFFVSNIMQADVIADVFDHIERAIANGDSFGDFKKAVKPALTEAWGGTVANPPARIENVFRTNVLGAYNAGRRAQMADPIVKRRRPYWQFRATIDKRTSDICEPLNGTTLPADDPFWAGATPPLHYQCRSLVVPLTVEQAEAEGIADSPPISTAQPGFGQAPTEAGDRPRPEREYPPEIRAIVAQKLREAEA